MSTPAFWCPVNLSEGRDPGVAEAVRRAVEACSGVLLADHSWDADHHRQVVSMVGPAGALKQAVAALFELAEQHLDLSAHVGVHPRIGAVDVVPFVPLEGATMEQAIALAREVGAEVASRFDVPVFLYEEAALRPDRRRLPDLRRGQLEGVAARMLTPEGQPDFGPSRLHPRLGASVVGARVPLTAYNVLLDTVSLELGKAIARDVKGRLANVRALPMWLESRQKVQLSMNLLRPTETGMGAAFEAVRSAAAEHGVEVLSSELIGLVALEELLDVARHALRLEQLDRKRIVEWHQWQL